MKKCDWFVYFKKHSRVRYVGAELYYNLGKTVRRFIYASSKLQTFFSGNFFCQKKSVGIKTFGRKICAQKFVLQKLSVIKNFGQKSF